MIKTHYGDPCIHCGVAHDDVPSGACIGTKPAVPIAYRCISVRRDGVERFLILMSDGSIEDRWEHFMVGLEGPGGYLHGARYDNELRHSADKMTEP